jgi:hypothetical protein
VSFGGKDQRGPALANRPRAGSWDVQGAAPRAVSAARAFGPTRRDRPTGPRRLICHARACGREPTASVLLPTPSGTGDIRLTAPALGHAIASDGQAALSWEVRQRARRMARRERIRPSDAGRDVSPCHAPTRLVSRGVRVNADRGRPVPSHALGDRKDGFHRGGPSVFPLACPPPSIRQPTPARNKEARA